MTAFVVSMWYATLPGLRSLSDHKFESEVEMPVECASRLVENYSKSLNPVDKLIVAAAAASVAYDAYGLDMKYGDVQAKFWLRPIVRNPSSSTIKQFTFIRKDMLKDENYNACGRELGQLGGRRRRSPRKKSPRRRSRSRKSRR